MSKSRSRDRRQMEGHGKKKCIHARWQNKPDAERAAAEKKGKWEAMKCPACGWWKLVSR